MARMHSRCGNSESYRSNPSHQGGQASRRQPIIAQNHDYDYLVRQIDELRREVADMRTDRLHAAINAFCHHPDHAQLFAAFSPASQAVQIIATPCEDLIDLGVDNDTPSRLIQAATQPAVLFEWGKDIAFKSKNSDIARRRSVLIEGISAGTALPQLFDQLGCQRIISIVYCKTAGMRTSPSIRTDCAIVALIRALYAADFIQACLDKNLKASIINMPSRPLHLQLVECIEAKRVSRKLLLQDKHATIDVLLMLKQVHLPPIRTTEHGQQTIFEFASVLNAKQACLRLFADHKIHTEYHIG